MFEVIAFICTQPLGGVALWSLIHNEGPFIVLLGTPVFAALFGLGLLANRTAGLLRQVVMATQREAP